MMPDVRLIDANALPNYKCQVTTTVGDQKGPAEMRFVFWQDIEKAPTIEVAKVVVHARWKHNPPTSTLVSSYNCTACGFFAFDHRVNECKYCPNCGAIMDGGASDGSDA